MSLKRKAGGIHRLMDILTGIICGLVASLFILLPQDNNYVDFHHHKDEYKSSLKSVFRLLLTQTFPPL